MLSEDFCTLVSNPLEIITKTPQNKPIETYRPDALARSLHPKNLFGSNIYGWTTRTLELVTVLWIVD